MSQATTENTEGVVRGLRGALEHEARDRILAAAEARFRHYGFAKTTIGDIAGDLGISGAYIYKFYASKLAVCEAIVAQLLDRVDAALNDVCALEQSASQRLRLLYQTILERSLFLYFEDRKLHDMMRVAVDQNWPAISRHKDALRSAAKRVVEAGRESGEFDPRLPVSDAVDAIWISLIPFAHPAVLEHLSASDDLERHARHMADLALRGVIRS